MLAPDGRCKTLDASADGYVRAEACVVLLLQELDSTLPCAAVFAGSAVNQVCDHTLVCICCFSQVPQVATRAIVEDCLRA